MKPLTPARMMSISRLLWFESTRRISEAPSDFFSCFRFFLHGGLSSLRESCLPFFSGYKPKPLERRERERKNKTEDISHAETGRSQRRVFSRISSSFACFCCLSLSVESVFKPRTLEDLTMTRNPSSPGSRLSFYSSTS